MIIFFFNDTETTEIYTLSLHDALPIWAATPGRIARVTSPRKVTAVPSRAVARRRKSDRKSTRLNSSHANISYAVFCLKKKKIKYHYYRMLTHSSTHVLSTCSYNCVSSD